MDFACERRPPSQVTQDYWIYAYRQCGSYPDSTADGSGKWMIFVARENIDSVWKAIAEAVNQGCLG